MTTIARGGASSSLRSPQRSPCAVARIARNSKVSARRACPGGYLAQQRAAWTKAVTVSRADERRSSGILPTIGQEGPAAQGCPRLEHARTTRLAAQRRSGSRIECRDEPIARGRLGRLLEPRGERVPGLCLALP